jgi:SAM-dependent methyltransferase
MRRCLRCAEQFEAGAGWKCPRCAFAPADLGGTPVFAPDLARAEADYEAAFFAPLFDAEPRSFWFRGRSALIARILQKIDPTPQAILEIGCGTGFVLQEIARAFPHASLTATDVLPDAFDYARRRVPQAQYLQVDVTALPFAAEFDLVCAFDVFEHVADDEKAFREVHRSLRSGGWLLLTVPQHRALWSGADDVAHHKRRYERREMKRKLEAAGFRIVRRTSFVTLLMPALFISRKRVQTAETVIRDLVLPRPVDTTLAGIMALERLFINLGTDLPVGGSSVVLARRT